MHSMKMATLGDMAAGMAHELNTPLGLLSLSLEQLAKCSSADTEKKSLFDEIRIEMNDAVLRMPRLISGFKTFSRNSHEGEFVFTSSKKLLEESFSICEMSLKNQCIDFKLPMDVPDIQMECNPTEISQVLINLVQNSRDAIERLEEKWIEVKIDYSTNLNITVTDSGSRIPMELQIKIFTPFFTTKEVGKGTGLGLGIIKGIVDRHNGQICIDQINPNTSFKIEIPITQSLGDFLLLIKL